MAKPMPTVFFGHGNPMNAVLNNAYTKAWATIGREIPRPKAILAISAHWYVQFTAVTAMSAPKTIHDFGGFPPELYRIGYPAPGDPALASEVQALLSPGIASLDEKWGLDHGAWTVLRRVFPDADVPVIQLSIDETKAPPFHYELGRKLAPLRDEGVLVIGSGNLVHNLHAYAWGRRPVEPFDWALRFEKRVRELLLAGDDRPLVECEQLGRDAALAAPTPDHYLPLLYVLALRRPDDKIDFPVEGIDGGSISMLAVRLG